MGIGKATFQSAGQISQHLIPGAYSRIDSVRGSAGLASANNGCIMGQCTGGQPTTLLQFNTAAEAVSTLRSGPLMEAVKLAFSPGNDLNPQRIFAMRVNNATQGTLDLDDSGANKILQVDSINYGLWVNQITVTVAAGTTNGKKITIGFQDNTETFDNLYRASLTIQNTGGASNLVITNTSAAQTFVTDTTNPLSIDLNQYPTIGELATYIDAQTGYTCTATAGQENASSLNLDGLASTDINTAPVVVQSTNQAIVDGVSAGSVYVDITVANGSNNRIIIDNLSATNLASGSEGSYTSTEWTAALTALEAEDIQFISTPDTTAAQHAQIKTHCESMSAVTGKRERQFCVGAPWGTGTVATDVASAISAAQTLNSKYGLYVFNGVKAYNNAGTLTNFAAGYAACMYMGMKCAAAINMPLTFKTLNVVNLEYKLSDANLEQLIENGVAPNAFNTNNLPHVSRQVNTYQTDDLKWNEFSMVSQMLFASRDLRSYLENLYIGQPGTAVTGGALKGAVINRLNIYDELGIFIRDPATNASFWNVTITLSGDEVIIDYDAYITAPVNFIFVTNHFHELVAAA